MKVKDLFEVAFQPKIGKCYKLGPDLGDYSNSIVYVEKGPRNSGTDLQWRVSWGPENYDADWLNILDFDGCSEVPNPGNIQFIPK